MSKYKKLKKYQKPMIWGFVNTVMVTVLLSACSNQRTEGINTHEDEYVSSEAAISQTNLVTVEERGARLTEVAGPVMVEQALEDKIEPVSDQSMPYVGRYHTEISCHDEFAHCEKGSAEFIINLLPDGTAHRTFVYKGRVSNDTNEESGNRNYKNNTWHYDAENHQIVVQRVEGTQFFYKVDNQNNLVIDRERILNVDEINHQYFTSEGHHAPEQNYVMKKF